MIMIQSHCFVCRSFQWKKLAYKYSKQENGHMLPSWTTVSLPVPINMLVLFHIILEIPLLSFTHSACTQNVPFSNDSTRTMCPFTECPPCPFFRLRETLPRCLFFFPMYVSGTGTLGNVQILLLALLHSPNIKVNSAIQYLQ